MLNDIKNNLPIRQRQQLVLQQELFGGDFSKNRQIAHLGNRQILPLQIKRVQLIIVRQVLLEHHPSR